MNDLWIETGSISMNKHGETLCGDKVELAGGGDEDLTLVLADGLHCLPAKLTPLGPGRSVVEVQEGKYHQVRRMLASRGLPVTYLRREAEGRLTLGDLPLGQTKELNIVEAEQLLLNIL